MTQTKPEFRTITGDDWRRSLALARLRRATAKSRLPEIPRHPPKPRQ
jgi:hypothetical protein